MRSFWRYLTSAQTLSAGGGSGSVQCPAPAPCMPPAFRAWCRCAVTAGSLQRIDRSSKSASCAPGAVSILKTAGVGSASMGGTEGGAVEPHRSAAERHQRLVRRRLSTAVVEWEEHLRTGRAAALLRALDAAHLRYRDQLLQHLARAGMGQASPAPPP